VRGGTERLDCTPGEGELVLGARPASEIAAALIEDSERGRLLRETRPVFGRGLTSREVRHWWSRTMLRRDDIDHILRAAASITNHRRFVVIGTGAVIITARHIPASMTVTPEIDLYADGISDPEPMSDLIDITIGHGSMFHRTFHYHGDGVSPNTAIMPTDWRVRATEYTPSDGSMTAVCPSADDIAIAELSAWRDKDRDWLRDAVQSGIVNLATVETLLRASLPATAPDAVELERRLRALAEPSAP
jgi:hypothetical protein